MAYVLITPLAQNIIMYSDFSSDLLQTYFLNICKTYFKIFWHILKNFQPISVDFAKMANFGMIFAKF